MNNEMLFKRIDSLIEKLNEASRQMEIPKKKPNLLREVVEPARATMTPHLKALVIFYVCLGMAASFACGYASSDRVVERASTLPGGCR